MKNKHVLLCTNNLYPISSKRMIAFITGFFSADMQQVNPTVLTQPGHSFKVANLAYLMKTGSAPDTHYRRI